VRFVAKAGGDCLYAQALLEPKVEIKSVRVAARCYPSGFVSAADRHDFRFVFFDYAGKKNEAAEADLRGRAQTLLEELTTLAFTDPSLARWPLPEKQAEIRQVLASVPQDKETAAQYERWGRELAAQLKLVHSGSAGAIMAEANAAKTIGEWERGLPTLKLKALLNEI